MKIHQMEQLNECPLCQHSDFSLWLHVKDFSISQESFDIASCNHCGFKFTNPRPCENIIGKYYQSENYLSHHDESRGVVAWLYKWVREHITLKQKRKWVEKMLPYRGNLLDVGCGMGHFLLHMHQHGWSVQGIEPALEVSKKIQEKGIQVYSHFEQMPCQPSFDAISLWHVLEHVHCLKDYLQKIKILLKASGYLFIAVPNLDSYDARFYQNYWAALDVPRHLYHFTPTHMEQLLEKVGLKITKVIGMPLDVYYICLLSSEYRAGKKRWIEALFRASLSNWHALQDNNYSSLLYIVNKIN